MRIVIDGTEIESGVSDAASAMASVRTWAEKAERVVTEVVLDGSRLTDVQLGDLDSVPSGETLEASTSPAGELVAGAFRDAATALGQARDDQIGAADLIDAGKLSEAMERLGGCMTAWDAARRVLEQGSALVGEDPETVRVSLPDGSSVAAGGPEGCIETLAGQLRELKRALGDQDVSAVSDVLRYDLSEQSDKWSALLTGTAERLARV